MKCCKVTIECHACFLWALLLLSLPIKWMCAFYLAVLIHELFHYGALTMMGKKVEQIRVGFRGIQMQTYNLSYQEEMICALAGPFGGGILLAALRWYPELSICGLLHSLYNLLPIYPLDGGRALRCAANIIFPYLGDSLFRVIEIAVICGLIILLAVMKQYVLSVLCGIFLIRKLIAGKIPCKQTFLGVQ